MQVQKTLFIVLATVVALALAFLRYFWPCKSPGVLLVDEKYAAKVVRDALSIPGTVSAKKLAGGATDAQLFRVSDDLKEYIVRCKSSTCQESFEQYVYNSKVASDGGYGPQIYFADPARGIVIMEYLPSKISYQNLRTDQWVSAFARFLQKIHQGKEFKNDRYDVFEKITHDLRANKSKCENIIPLAKIEQIVTVIRRALAPHQTTAPTHNDLHMGNLRCWGNECKAIDYENAGPGDPYFDVATIAVSPGFYSNQAQEKVLFATYLGRQPSAVEEARFYLMKQAVLIKWAVCDNLRRLPPEQLEYYGTIKIPSIQDYMGEILEGKLVFGKLETRLKDLKALLKEVFENFESQEFRNAVSLLSK
jgi:thiamine kinase-like enzyme